jgi:hypothetical protein
MAASANSVHAYFACRIRFSNLLALISRMIWLATAAEQWMLHCVHAVSDFAPEPIWQHQRLASMLETKR